MAEEEPWITQTQNTLGAVINAPRLTPKLLVRPPFRFIHDCVTNFMSTTGMLEGLYDSDELDGWKVTTRDAKIDFLQKLLTTLDIALGMEVDCRPTKVISGLEPENTNYMLQALGQLASVPKEKVAAAVDEARDREPWQHPTSTAPSHTPRVHAGPRNAHLGDKNSHSPVVVSGAVALTLACRALPTTDHHVASLPRVLPPFAAMCAHLLLPPKTLDERIDGLRAFIKKTLQPNKAPLSTPFGGVRMQKLSDPERLVVGDHLIVLSEYHRSGPVSTTKIEVSDKSSHGGAVLFCRDAWADAWENDGCTESGSKSNARQAFEPFAKKERIPLERFLPLLDLYCLV